MKRIKNIIEILDIFTKIGVQDVYWAQKVHNFDETIPSIEILNLKLQF